MKASSSITISHINDGLTTFYQYAKNTSNTTIPSSGWSTTVPVSEAGKFIWRREGYGLIVGDVSVWGNEVCLTGAKGDKGEQGPQGLIGPQGNVGPVGQGIDSITEQYAISTNKVTPPAEGSSSWKDVAPTWSTGKYLWTRSKIVYKNPTDTKYTTPVCDNAWEAVNEIQVGGRNYYSPSMLKNLALSSSVVSGTLYRGFYIPVKEGDVWTLSREALTNNRFRYVFTEDEPASGTTYFGGTGNSTTYDLSLIIKGIEVPPYTEEEKAKYLFVYLSNQGDDIPKIKLEKGNQATD